MSRRRLGVWAGALAAAAVGSAWSFLPGSTRGWNRLEADNIRTAAVGRSDLTVWITAGGQVESAKETVVTCELENLQFSSKGQSLFAGGSTTILTLLAEGSTVRSDDVLCRLDSSEYEELVRQQQLKVQTSTSERDRAVLDLDAARAQLKEFRDGIRAQRIEEYEGKIAAFESELERARDRLTWSERMLTRKYVTAAQVAADRHNLIRCELNVSEFRSARKSYIEYEADSAIRKLDLRIQGLESMRKFQDQRLDRQLTQLRQFQRQVDRCTIRAPHAGFLIYAPTPDGRVVVEEGAWVRQKQPLFRLPDLSRLVVRTLLHESVVNRIRRGMRARVKIEALQGQQFEGSVVSVGQLPLTPRNWTESEEIKNYEGRVALDGAPKGLLPGMSAEVEIEAGRHAGALVIPSEALAVEGGKEFCYVAAAGEDMERRAVDVDPATEDMLEVMSGLKEGERVVLNPSEIKSELEDGEHAGAGSSEADPAAAGGKPVGAPN